MILHKNINNLKNKGLVILILLYMCLFIFSCDDTNTDKVNNNLENIETAYLPELIILKHLKTVKKELLPSLINLYFLDSSIINAQLIDDNTVKFYLNRDEKYKQVNVHLFQSEHEDKFFGISYIEYDSLNFSSYFYFIQHTQNKWQNSTIDLLPYFAVEVLRKEENINIKFKNPSRKLEFSAYSSINNKTAVNLLFEKEGFKIEKLSRENLNEDINVQKILECNYKNGGFEVSKLNEGVNSTLLDYYKLDNQKRFTNFQDAFTDSSKAYILDLSGKELTNLLAEIAMLKKLQILILNDNNLTKLPQEIGVIKNLQILKAKNNKIKFLPKELLYLKNLEELCIQNNELIEIPSEICNLQFLRKINFENNNIKEFNVKITELKLLISLNLSNNKIIKLPAEIGNLSNLRFLDISNNNISQLPIEITNLKKLKILNIKNTLLTSDDIEKTIRLLPNTEIVY